MAGRHEDPVLRADEWVLRHPLAWALVTAAVLAVVWAVIGLTWWEAVVVAVVVTPVFWWSNRTWGRRCLEPPSPRRRVAGD